MVFGSNYAVKEAVRNNLGITIISRSVVEHSAFDKELSLITLGEQYKRVFSYVLIKDREVDEIIKTFIEYLK